MNRRLFALGVALLMLGGLLSGAPVVSASTGSQTDGPPGNYTETKGLSQPKYKTVRESYEVEMKDGIHIYVEVVRPKAPGRFGTILELSPYHGTLADRDGTRILPGPKKDNKAIGLTGYFAPRGYAVVMADLRGTGRSEGCLDHLGPKDAADSKEIVEWAAKQKWSNGRVGMTGHSYVGSTPSMAAAQNPPHLATIVPSAGLAAMYHHEFQNGVPYNLQWAGPLFAYEQISMERHLPGEDNSLQDMQYFGCGWTQSAAVTGEAYFSGAETQWHKERDHRKGATKADIPVFMVHGSHDNAARIPAIDWFNARNNPADKIWIGQWDHGSGKYPTNRTCPQTAVSTPCKDDEWTTALHAWFDKHLLGRNVDTGPSVEAFLNTNEVYTAKQWPPPANDVSFFPHADGSLATRPDDEGSLSYLADHRGFQNEFSTDGNALVFETAALKEDMLIVGMPKLRLTASITSPRVHLIASLYDAKGDSLSRIGRTGWAINPELREGWGNPQPVIPTQKMIMNIEGQAQAHLIEAGHKLVLRIQSSHPDKVPTFAEGTLVTVYVGGKDGTKFTLPVVPRPTIYRDHFTVIP